MAVLFARATAFRVCDTPQLEGHLAHVRLAGHTRAARHGARRSHPRVRRADLRHGCLFAVETGILCGRRRLVRSVAMAFTTNGPAQGAARLLRAAASDPDSGGEEKPGDWALARGDAGAGECLFWTSFVCSAPVQSRAQLFLNAISRQAVVLHLSAAPSGAGFCASDHSHPWHSRPGAEFSEIGRAHV